MIRTEPGPDSTLHRGDPVTLVVSKGPEMIEVPRVRGLGVGTAERRLRAAGFDVSVVRSSFYFGSGLVIGESPSGGQKAHVGSTITLTIV